MGKSMENMHSDAMVETCKARIGVLLIEMVKCHYGTPNS